MDEGELLVDLDYDVFRDSPARYLGYTNELGEAFKLYIQRRTYLASYGLAIAYALGDAVHKGNQRYEYANHVHIPQEPKIAAAGAVLDTAIWQGLASVALPGLVINRVVATTRFFSLKSSLPPRVATLLPTIAGLSAIPFIIKPIDKLVDRFMDSYVRPHIHLTVEHLSSDGEGQDSQGSSNVHNNTSQEQQQRSS
eukprot:m.150068 g.150068  ORF g.150068 m.150068 type:complete len:196 (+) comp16167_c7_seq2:31-618(+)